MKDERDAPYSPESNRFVTCAVVFVALLFAFACGVAVGALAVIRIIQSGGDV